MEFDLAQSPEFNTMDFARKVNEGMDENTFKPGAFADDVIDQIVKRVHERRSGR